MDQLLKPEQHHYLLASITAVCAISIMIAGGPYLLAQSDPSQVAADTALTEPAPNTIVPTLLPTPIESVYSNESPQPLPKMPPLPPEVLKALPPEILKQLGLPFGDPKEKTADEARVRQRDLQAVVREINKLRRELKQLAQDLAKATNAADEQKQVSEISTRLDATTAAIKAGPESTPDAAAKAIADFRASNIYEQVAALRAKAELPRRLKRLEQEIVRVQKLGLQPSFQTLGLNLAKLVAKLENFRVGYNQALDELKQGDYEASLETMHNLETDGHPAEAVEVIYRLGDLQRFLKQVKDKDVLDEANGIVQPIVTAFNAGEFDQARELMAEAFPELTKLAQIAQRLERSRTGNRADMMEKFGTLEEKLMQKYVLLGDREASETKPRLSHKAKPAATERTNAE